MGLFDFLFSSKAQTTVQVSDDRIWMSTNAKFNGIRQQIKQTADSAAILLIAHFDETLEQLQAVTAGYEGNSPLQATLAENLTTETAAKLSTEKAAVIDLIVAERHPLWSVDELILRFVENVPCRCRVAYHLSLDDGLFKWFVVGLAKNILDSLGLKEDEPLDGEMLSRRVKDAQKRIEKRAFGNSRAKSAVEWLELNMPKS